MGFLALFLIAFSVVGAGLVFNVAGKLLKLPALLNLPGAFLSFCALLTLTSAFADGLFTGPGLPPAPDLPAYAPLQAAAYALGWYLYAVALHRYAWPRKRPQSGTAAQE